jgi:hypothetical protein
MNFVSCVGEIITTAENRIFLGILSVIPAKYLEKPFRKFFGPFAIPIALNSAIYKTTDGVSRSF